MPGDVSSVMSECPDGFFCPNGTGYNWDGCPAGTFGNAPRLTQASECTPCTAGYYCQGTLNSSSASSHHLSHYVVFSNKTLYPLLSTG